MSGIAAPAARRYVTLHTVDSAAATLTPAAPPGVLDVWALPGVAPAAWEAAFWWWAYFGDASRIDDLASKSVPIDGADVATIAGMLAGSISPKAPELGRRAAAGAGRDILIHRHFAEVLVEIRRHRRSGQVVDTRWEAAAVVVERFASFRPAGLRRPLRALTAEGVLRKVDRKPRAAVPSTFESLVNRRRADKT